MDTGYPEAYRVLRARAEVYLRRMRALGQASEKESADPAAVEWERVLYELQVHQVELEMQNDELHQSQEALVEARNRYRRLYDFAPVGILTITARGVIVEANFTGAEMFRVDRRTLEGRRFAEYVAPESQDTFYLHRRRAIETGMRAVCETICARADGTRFHAQLDSIAIPERSESERSFRMSVTDISLLRETEDLLHNIRDDVESQVRARTAELEAAYRRLESGFEEHDRSLSETEAAETRWMSLIVGAYELIISADLDGRIHRIDGIPAQPGTDELLGTSVYALIAPSRRELASRMIERAIAGRKEVSWEFVARDEGVVTVAETATVGLIMEDGTVAGFALAVREVSAERRDAEERRTIETLARRTERIEWFDTFARAVAPDLEDAWGAVYAHAERAYGRLPAGSPAQENIDRIVEETERAFSVVDRMRAACEKYPRDPRLVGIAGIIDAMRPLFAHMVPEKVSVALELDDAPYVWADPDALRRIMACLVENAVDAIGDGASTITIAAATATDYDPARSAIGVGEAAAGAWARIEVRDTGRGMSEETVRMALEPFFTTKPDAHGLGLAVVAAVVRAHRGGIEISSTPGAGTTVRLFLPAATKAEVAAHRTESEPAIPRVVLVDDRAESRKTGELNLRMLGCETLAASDGDAALAVIRERAVNVDAIVLDLGSAGLGLRLVDDFRAIDPDVPIVIASALDADEIARRLDGRTVEAVVRKPYRAADLEHAIEIAVG